jgi:hypothetical protein
MANETNKKSNETTATVSSADTTVRELEASIENLPRTDHMTLPALMVNTIDAETAARMKTIETINEAKKPDDVVDETGRTFQQVRNQFEFGVTELDEKGSKHEFEVGSDGSITVIAPEINDEHRREVTIVPTPANIAPVDADAPKDPVEARVAEGKAEDGSEGEATGAVGKETVFVGTPVLTEELPVTKPATFGTDVNVGKGKTDFEV